MSYSCKILLDSISETGKRITTFEITFPRIVLAEAKTHRVLRGWGQNVELEYLQLDLHNLGINDDKNLSRNSASSRAIPLKKQIERISQDPFIPERFPVNCSGMQPQEWITKESDEHEYAKHRARWLEKRDLAIKEALYDYTEYNWHKQLICRPLEVFMWHTAIVTATEFDNFFKLRTHTDAQYEIKRIADLMYDAYHSIEEQREVSNRTKFETLPRIQKLKVGEWHTPLVYEEDELAILHYISLQDTENGEYQRKVQYKNFKSPEIGSLDNGSDEELYSELISIKKQISVARCARVSYLTHDGKRDIEKDLELFERLRTSGHWSPFEHVATPNCETISDIINTAYYIPKKNHWSGNFLGWKQYRKEFADENCTNFRK